MAGRFRPLLALACFAVLLAGRPTGGLSLGLAVAVAGAGSTASGSPESARELLDHARSLDHTSRAWKDRRQKLALVIRDGRGGERRRELVMKTLRGEGGEDKTLTVFVSPVEIRGTSFLQFAHRDRDAEQWLWLPALGRSRQISSRSKEESFVGTDFSYRDLELLTDVLEWNEEEARSSLLGSETLDGTELVKIELVPVRKDVGYRRIRLALSRPDLVIRRMEFFGEGEAPRKVLRLDGIEMVGVVPTARRLEMSQPAASTSTVVDVSDVHYDQGFSPDSFTQHALESAGDEAGG